MDGSARPNDGTEATTTTASGVHRARRAVLIALAVVGLGGALAACGDDEGTAVVSEEAYLESVTAQCERHSPALLQAWDDLRAAPFSDAELAAFYTSEMVPRVRSILRAVRNDGLPADEAVHEGFNTAAAALQEIDDDPAGLIDRRRDGTFLEDENPWIELNEALAVTRITCVIEENDWEP